ncbi:hypothetical protein C1I95_33900, partial [Micromonospora craterilacus]
MFAFLAATARRLAGLTLLALLTAGTPYALLRYVGWPLPRQIPTWQQIGAALTSPMTDAMLGSAVVCLLWLAWAAFVWSLIVEVTAAVTGVRLPQPRAIAPARGLAALLVAAITGGVLATAAQAAPTLGQPAHATSHHTNAAVPSAAATATASSTTREAVADTPEAPVRDAHTLPASRTGADDPMSVRLVAGQLTLVSSGTTYACQVKRGDTLSGIADTWLGDPNRWPEIFALNRGTHFPDVGGTLTNPHLIYPGWTLQLPDDATPPAGTRQPATPPVNADAPAT